jgi:hypothetical protein
MTTPLVQPRWKGKLAGGPIPLERALKAKQLGDIDDWDFLTTQPIEERCGPAVKLPAGPATVVVEPATPAPQLAPPAPEVAIVEDRGPPALYSEKCWSTWRSLSKPGSPKPAKFPNTPTTKRELWTTYAEAKSRLRRGEGIGLLLGAGVTGVDIDAAYDDDGHPDPRLDAVLARKIHEK